MIKILHITPDFNYSCGRSKLVYLYFKYFGNHPDYEIHFISNGGDSLDRLNDKASLKFQRLEFSTGYKNLFYYRNFYTKLKKYIRNNKIDLVHTHHRFPEMVAVKIEKKLKIKTVISTHGFTRGFKNISFQSDKIFSVSNSINRYLMNNFNIKKDKIISLYNPIENVTQIDFRLGEQFKSENDISSDMKLLLFVGRISKDKGIDTLIKSFTSVKEKIENVFLVINGQLEKKKYRQYLDEDKIIYVPPQNDISHLYYIADIVILPSRTDSFPYVMLEAGTFKKTFIGGNTGGIAEFIDDGGNGLLVDPENSEQLAEKIIYLLNNPDVGKKFGENLHRKVNELCDYYSYFNQVEKIYNKLVEAE